MKPLTRPSRCRRFTLVEILVTILVTALLFAAVFAIFTSVMENRRKLPVEYEARHSALAVLSILTRELSYAFKFYKNEDNCFLGKDDTVDSLEADSIAFLTSAPDIAASAEQPAVVRKVSYGLVPYTENGTPVQGALRLVRHSVKAHSGVLVPDTVAPLPAGAAPAAPASGLSRPKRSSLSDDEEGKGFALLDGVRGLKIQYWNGREWLNEWDGASAQDYPKAVRVDLAVAPVAAPVEERQPFDFSAEIQSDKGDFRFQAHVAVDASGIVSTAYSDQ